MSGTKSTGKEAVLAEQLAEGTQKHIPASTPVMVGGGTFTPAQVVSQLRLAECQPGAGLAQCEENCRDRNPNKLRPYYRADYVDTSVHCHNAAVGLPDRGR